MSADSPRRSGGRMARHSGGSVCGNGGGQIVAPQTVTDPSIIDSVTEFINDVVPQAYTSTLPGDCKETITWARFETADINDPAFFPDSTSDTVLPLILTLGYNTGVQVWAIPASGEATEVLSWCQGSVRTLRILPSPTSNVASSSDTYVMKRPLVAICDSAGPGPPFCSVSFISLKTGDQVKSIKFKNPVCDVYANRRSVIVTFPERIAVFDACTLEDRLSITSCYLSPGPNANPVALGSRWLAYAEKKLVAWKRSSGGVGGGGAQSYTATVLHAAQTLGRGLRGLSETVASSLTGPRNHTGSQVGILGSSPPTTNGADHSSPGVVTVLDLEASSNRFNGADDVHSANSISAEGVIAHFIAHNEAIVALEFDPSGTLLLTADKRGHDFHVFRLQPHPGGSSLSAVHHLYVLHRGDTTAKVQDVAFSCDSRWVAVSTMRGTTHVFPLTPYGGPVGFRTHGSPLVVNRLSRFHRSAGLSADGRSSPVPSPETPPCLPAGPHANPRLPPYPHPSVQSPLAQLRQSPHPPLAPGGTLDLSLKVCATFALPRAWLLDSQTAHPRDGPRDSTRVQRRPVESLFVMAHHGNLVQYDLDPKAVTSDPREKVCDDTKIELYVEAKAQWPLQRSSHSSEVLPPLPSSNILLCGPELRMPSCESESNGQIEERWLSQVEIVTHAGPHRRLWMGPQITFKTLLPTTSYGPNVSMQDVEAVEVGTVPVSRPARSNPVNMPSGGRPVVPVLIESGSGSSLEQSPHLLEVYGADSGESEHWGGHGDSRLREDLADAMLESPGAPSREKGQRRDCGLVGEGEGGDGVGEGRGVCPVRRVVNPGGAEITMRSRSGSGCEESDVDLAVPIPIPLSDHVSDQPQLAAHHWEAIAIPASAPLIPVPHDPAPDSAPQRQLVTTIAASAAPAPAPRPPAQPAQPALSHRVSECPTRSTEKSTATCASSAASDVVKKGSADGSAGKEKERCGRRGSEGKKKPTPEREVECGKETCKVKDQMKSDSVKSVDVDDSLVPRKKGRISARKDADLACAKDASIEDSSSLQADDVISNETITSKLVIDMIKDSEGLSGIVSKKGKKSSSIQESVGDNVVDIPKVLRKSTSPQKDGVDEKYEKRSSITPEKELVDESYFISSKKNKKKTVASSKDVVKQYDDSPNVLSSESKLESDTAVSSNFEGELYMAEDVEIYSCSKKTVSNELENGSDCLQSDSTSQLSDKQISKLQPQSEPTTTLKGENEEIFNRRGSDSTDQSKETVKPVLQVQKLSKSARRALRAQQVLEAELVSKSEAEDSSDGKPVSDAGVTACNDSICCKDDILSEGSVVETKNTNIPKSKKGTKLKERDSDIGDESVEAVLKDLEEAALDVHCYKETNQNNKGSQLAIEKDTSSKDNRDVISIDFPVKFGKKGFKSLKAKSNDNECKMEAPDSFSPDCVTPSVWKMQSTSDLPKDENFPTLSSKYTKKAWGVTSNEDAVVQILASEKDVGSRKSTADVDRNAAKPKRGWEIPCNAPPSEMDVEKLTFEDLEAIVDAACTEEESKIDKTCLKENKKGKKNDLNSVMPQKTKGKENVEEEVVTDSGLCVDKIEVIDVPKPQEELIKQDEPVKPPEKTLATPNRSSKAHRKKRRRMPISCKLLRSQFQQPQFSKPLFSASVTITTILFRQCACISKRLCLIAHR
ncbi:Breast carcinoma-amplified sequence 3 [Frankliniella fusca]|uniref:Breast carcinoma-amplified sequence 3 n=1 Tax=Frankliniella fusca TaxID=407009 RepID=A0AAE1HU49_9NEOP|nr:Breast carcinoma-amplified sequence 3 [Frankliniella fusca]